MESRLVKMSKEGKKAPENLRLYVMLKDSHVFINNGTITPGFATPNIAALKNRDDVMSVFSKMGFLFDEMIRFLIVGYANDEKSKRLLYVLNLIPLNRKIRLFLDWKIFDEEFTRNMSRLFEVRNGLVHSVNMDVEYRKDRTMNLSNKKDLGQFKEDLQKAWDKLSAVYVENLSKTNWEKAVSEIK